MVNRIVEKSLLWYSIKAGYGYDANHTGSRHGYKPVTHSHRADKANR
ncbi:hypothetical protein SAMN06296065_11629 [Novosphingobium panipatense]|uniref:Uncharacterized protein n=1 Tax=Novosphingobium panipatense TaxID=428991 RepID=A0ABY1QWD1_9SPHN|nr:hypothetical protein SAMN06296065_11629 [Novosphingobium panipatense]